MSQEVSEPEEKHCSLLAVDTSVLLARRQQGKQVVAGSCAVFWCILGSVPAHYLTDMSWSLVNVSH